MINIIKKTEIKNLQESFSQYFKTFNIKIPCGFKAASTKEFYVENLTPDDLVKRYPYVFESIIFDLINEITNGDQKKMYLTLTHLQHSTKYIRKFLTNNLENISLFTYKRLISNDGFNKSNLENIYIYNIEKDKYKLVQYRSDYFDIFRREKIDYDLQDVSLPPKVLFEANDDYFVWRNKYEDINMDY
jgi:hypothetical protein